MTQPWLSEHWSFFNQRLEQGRLGHALMVAGPAGTGKKAMADAMVAKLLCTELSSELNSAACGQCRSCKLLVGGAHPDRFDIQPEEDSEVIKVDQIRALISSLDLTTSISNRKVACIHPAETMNIAAANALLKSLEEPAGDTVLILVCHDMSRLPVTIISRCQTISVRQPDRETAINWLTTTTAASAADSSIALEAAGGSPLRAQRYLDSPAQDSFGSVRKALATLIERPASVSLLSSQLIDLAPDELWRWLSLCAGEAVKSVMLEAPLEWLPAGTDLEAGKLLELQKQADINRKLSTTPIRGDLLLHDWLIRWAEQRI